MTDFFETPTDTGVDQSDSITLKIWLHFTISDTGVTLTESLVPARRRFKTITDTGTTNTDSILRSYRRGRANSDTGVTNTDTLLRLYRAAKLISDTGMTQTDAIIRETIWLHVIILDDGAAISDILPAHVYYSAADTGITVTDVLAANVINAPDAMFTYLCSRNWNYIENQSGWSADAFARFSYSTIPD